MKFFFGIVFVALVVLASAEESKTKLHPVNAVPENEANSVPNARNRRGLVYTSSIVAAPAIAAAPIAAPIAAAPVAYAAPVPVAYSYSASYPYAYAGYGAYAAPVVL